MSKPKRLPRQYEAEKRHYTTLHFSETECAPANTGFSVLCSICKATCASARKNENTFSWFHGLLELLESATHGCHLFTLLVSNMRLEDRSPSNKKLNLASQQIQPVTSSARRLKVETRYVPPVGVTIILRHSDALDQEIVAEVNLFINNGARKPMQLCTFIYNLSNLLR